MMLPLRALSSGILRVKRQIGGKCGKMNVACTGPERLNRLGRSELRQADHCQPTE